MVVQNISANGKETDLTFTVKTEDLIKILYFEEVFYKAEIKFKTTGSGFEYNLVSISPKFSTY